MERINRKFLVLPVFVSVGLLLSGPSRAVSLAVNPTESDSGDYPASAFGNAPSDPVREGRADSTFKVTHADRAPAGMVFEDDAEAAAAPALQAGAKHEGLDPEAPPISSPQIRRMTEAPQVTQDLIPSRTKGIQEISVIAGDLGFFPKVFFVSRDVPVRLFVTGASKKPLCIMMDSFQVRRQVTTQRIEEITFTPSVPGQYRFYCPMNGMEGTMVVKELASN